MTNLLMYDSIYRFIKWSAIQLLLNNSELSNQVLWTIQFELFVTFIYLIIKYHYNRQTSNLTNYKFYYRHTDKTRSCFHNLKSIAYDSLKIRLRTVKGTTNREQRIRISSYHVLWNTQFLIGNSYSPFSVPYSFYCVEPHIHS